MTDYLSEISEQLVSFSENVDIQNADMITDCFRKLRNMCSEGKNIQDTISKSGSIVLNTKLILENIQNRYESAPNTGNELNVCFRVGFQFLVNLTVDNSGSASIVWDLCSDLIRNSLQDGQDVKVQVCCCMILYNLILKECITLYNIQDLLGLLLSLTQDETTSEFPVYIIEHSIFNHGFISKYYGTLEATNRLIVLEILLGLVNTDKVDKLPVSCVMFLVKEFTRKSDNILKTVSDYVESMEPLEITKLLDFLASLSGRNELPFLKEMQNFKVLTINCSFLLKNIHSLGKETDNYFSSVQKLSDLENMGKENELQQHPAFGFKATLIRVVGNLCWHCEENQNLLRELETIQTLLDCCNIDARNPFIIQWVILAIRNLCYNNIENQKIIGSLSKEGNVDSRLLKEMGVTLKSDDGESSTFIAPLKNIK